MGTPVTDPNLIAQLEGGNNMQRQVVTDPNLIAQLESGGAPQQQQQPSMSPMMSSLSGINQSIEKVPRFIATTLASVPDSLIGLATHGDIESNPYFTNKINNFYNQREKQYKQDINQNPMAGMAGQFTGDTLSAIPAFAAAGAKVPANFLAGSLTGYAQSDPNADFSDKLINALVGGGSAAALSAIPGAAAAFSKFQPEKYAKSLISSLGGGMNKEQTAQSIAGAINNSYKNQVAKSSEIFSPVFEKVGANRVYDQARVPVNNFKTKDEALEYVNDLTGTKFDDFSDIKDFVNSKYKTDFDTDQQVMKFLNSAPNSQGSRLNSKYLSYSKDNFKDFDPSIRDLHSDYILNPTFDNAHLLRSQINSVTRELEKNPIKDAATRKELNIYAKAKDALSNDMYSFLDKQSPGLKSQYKQGLNFHRENVAPYLSDKNLAKIAEGKVLNPDNPHNIFANPEPNIKKIANDIGDDFKDKLVFSKLGEGQTRMDAQKLSNAIEDLSNKHGLGSYVTPKLNEQAGRLETLIKNRDVIPHWAQRAGDNAQIKALARALAAGMQSPLTKSVVSPQAANLSGLITGSY